MRVSEVRSRDRVGDNKGLEHNVRATPNLEFSSSRWHKRCLWRPRAASPVELSVTTAQADSVSVTSERDFLLDENAIPL